MSLYNVLGPKAEMQLFWKTNLLLRLEAISFREGARRVGLPLGNHDTGAK